MFTLSLFPEILHSSLPCVVQNSFMHLPRILHVSILEFELIICTIKENRKRRFLFPCNWTMNVTLIHREIYSFVALSLRLCKNRVSCFRQFNVPVNGFLTDDLLRREITSGCTACRQFDNFIA